MELVEEKLRARGYPSCLATARACVSTLCVAWPDGHVEEFEARVNGTVVWPPRGDKGFGYDPIFLRTDIRAPSVKCRARRNTDYPLGHWLVHRARAFLKLASLPGGR
jgi:XTP/dITP diphosphohydrolase